MAENSPRISFRVSESQVEAISKCAWECNVDVAKLVRAGITIGLPVLIENESAYRDEESEKLTDNISIQLDPNLELILRKTLVRRSTWKSASIIRSSLRVALPILRAYPVLIGHFNLRFLDVSNFMVLLDHTRASRTHLSG